MTCLYTSFVRVIVAFLPAILTSLSSNTAETVRRSFSDRVELGLVSAKKNEPRVGHKALFLVLCWVAHSCSLARYYFPHRC